MDLTQPINAYVCQYCRGSFDKLENLHKHVQKIHTVNFSGKENRFCPFCCTLCRKIVGYRNHLRHIHGYNEEGQVVLFKSFTDFLFWKNDLEKKNYCKYVMRELPKKLSVSEKVYVYRCDSSAGSMKEKKSGVAVKESCPAVITAIESTKTTDCKVEHWNSHVGHIIPIEEEELDAAIVSLGTTEIVLSSDQRYQYEGHSTDGNIFFITESNDASLPETFVREEPKKSCSLFQNTKNKAPENVPKQTPQKFSYKKDPTKKTGSFNYSLASVACMKPSAKKKIITPPQVTTSSAVAENISTAVTSSDVFLPAPISSASSSEIQLATEIINNEINSDILLNTDTSVTTPSKEETSTTHKSSLENITIANTSTISNHTFEFINDGSLSGQVVLLNSLPGQNSNQNVLLSPDQKFISIGPAINVETVPAKKRKSSKKSEQTNKATQFIVIPSVPEKENVSSIQNVSNLSQDSVSHETVLRSPVPSILKKAKKSIQKSPKKNALSKRKNATITPKNTVSPAKNITSDQTLHLGLNPSLNVTIIDADKSKQSATDNLAENVEIAGSVSSLKVDNSTATTYNTSIQTISTTSSPLIACNSVLSVTEKPVSSVIENSTSSKTQISALSSQSANSIVLNSFPPGQTFMSINNNLIPIGTPTAPLLPSNFSPGIVLASPISPSPVTRLGGPRMTYQPPTKSKITYSRRTSHLPGSSSTLPSKSSDKIIQSKQTGIGTAPLNSTVPLLLIPNPGPSVSSSSFIANSVNLSSSIRPNTSQPIVSSSLISSNVCPVLPRPLISNSNVPFIQLPPGTQLIPTTIIPTTFSSNSGQQISRPLLQKVPLITSTGQQISKAILQNVSLSASLIGQPPVAPRTIVSTTVSNTIKVQKVQLPFSKTTLSPSVTLTGITNVSPNLSESSKVSSVVLNSEPISSTPAIRIPPLGSIGPHKPGSVIFESQGDMYMLEPVDENVQISNTNSVRNVPNKMSIAVPNANENTKLSKLDEFRESVEVNKTNLSSLQKEKPVESQSFSDSRVDGKGKSLSPRKNSDVKNGVQIKSVVQEKRHLRDDDVEILKKVKYYQMEMKYLASQAECKRLKLELAKAQMKNKEIVKSKENSCSDEILVKENLNEDALHKDVMLDKDDLGLKQLKVDDKNADQSLHIQDMDSIKSTDQCNTDLDDSIHGSDIGAESGDSNCDNNSPVDSDDSNLDIVDLSSGKNQIKESFVDLINNHNSEGTNCDIESNKGSDLEIQKESSAFDKLQNYKSLQNPDNLNPSNNILKTDPNKELKDKSNSELINTNKPSENQFQILDSEPMDLNEIEESLENNTKNQSEKNSKVANQFKDQELDDKEENFMDFDDQNNNNFESEKYNPPCNNTQLQETLKDLEFQYGKESSDIYTMIRTSVLRSLYDDMKILCEENKKLYEKLQNCRSQEENGKIDELHSSHQ